MRIFFTNSKKRWIPLCCTLAFLNSHPSYAEMNHVGHSPITESLLFLDDSYYFHSQQEITGKIVDEQGKPISGATIREKNSKQTTQSGQDGTFTIKVSSISSTLIISSIGFGQKEIPANQASTITLQAEEDQIEEVVVVGFGTQKKVNLTGAISHVGKEAFENRPVANIGQALQGLVPNLNISFGNGSPNTTPGFNLRGGTSMAYNQNKREFETVNGDPLVIIDGVENTTAALNQLNPNDIQDMSFIKDASAGAIYGTKAAYGVILVRTKTGEFNQKGRISYNFDSNFDTPAALPDVLNSYEIQRASMDRTTWTNGSVNSSEENKMAMIQKYLDNPIPENAWYEESGKVIWVGNVNPFETAVKKWTPMQKHTLNFSGGGEAVNYYISTGLQNQSGMYKINTDEFKRYNALINVNAKITSWFNLFGKVSFDQTHYETPYLVGGKGNLWESMLIEPGRNINMPLTTGPNDPIPNAYTDNILSWISYGARNRSVNRRISLLASPEFIIIPSRLKVKADLAYQPQSYSLNRYSPKMAQVLESWSGLTTNQTEAQENRAYLDNNDRNNYMVNIYADYNNTWADKHNFSAILGYNQEQTTYEQITNTYRRLINPDIQNPNAVEDPTLNEATRYAETLAGRAVFGRVSYNYAEKYFLESNLRYDGNAKFTKDERFVAFPSFSAGWRISQEAFMEGLRNTVNELKLRGSWGKLGNQPGSAYPYQATLGSGRASFLLNGQQIVYINPPGLVSPHLTFEKAATWNIGLDAAFLQNKLDLTFEYYNRTTTDILTNGDAAYPNTLGANPPYVNSGTLETKGMELAIAWKETLDNGLRYRVGVNLSDYLTKVKHFAGNTSLNIENASGTEIMYSGKTIGEIWGYKSGGILQESDFNGKNPANGNWIYPGAFQGTLHPGFLRYQDIGGPEGIPDGKIDKGLNKIGKSGDRIVLGNSTPRYRFGITGNVQFKNFDLDVLIQGVIKRDVWTGNSAYWGGGAGSKWMLERSWTPERTDAEFPMYGGAPSVNDQYLINGSYLRLKQAVLGYTLPSTITEKLKIDRLRFTVSGFNLFEISEIPNVFDVDQISSAYPQKRSVAFGAQITF
ncbi:SusC/RagA family TonB-linked outer membrane protein [Sphingobacterium sp. DK4209]|uniref:SusC/RagA family TonB-linked outer membrane protein n=1 Tax=Sphingobacterium zhuxiongii TaxID=2662364 RepID=A0A5Q0Q5C7_9SPHI|nr:MULTISPECIES: SusC/RagA family TonB-linked outer membrane protein [unclassified Sphingobacterium]MVZ64935.1 SusC/RagA family TonB-linked outer membrane protein [Sphingobacterium sp. DK4209]QGA25275.1 SusC/RagA family TonB-linked outer membrane protein [Sphingobacterium sp. dk4302]